MLTTTTTCPTAYDFCPRALIARLDPCPGSIKSRVWTQQPPERGFVSRIRIMIICDTHTYQSYCFTFIHSQALHSVVGIYFIIAIL